MTTAPERLIITTVQVRAQDLYGGDLVKLQGVPVYTWTPPVSPDGWQHRESDGKWSNATIWQPGTWSLVYDVDNAQGDSSIDEAYEALNGQFTLLRVSQDEPNSPDSDDMYVAVERHQLVLIQRESQETER